ncbi:HEPN/Toprim-associated domain-containing protein [Pedobacter sp. SYSU D00535]|uniref:HEPN/Toprim-associated domain-containing protein n=1 Tax=Pedobacter sp. SYSU D00535 TaxID=2810308 RepID=UPI001A956CB7|nr:HEPN/Toprim-associated domain-containing protein [Pedobacter sp. SYSU D00535]
MGSYISLGVGELELDWGKNFGFRDYSKLFLPTDKKDIPYYYADGEVILKPGYSTSLGRVKNRLELLGYSLQKLNNHFQEHNDNYPDYLEQPKISFETMLAIFSKINIKDYKNKKEGGDYDLGEFVMENIFQNEIFKDLKDYIDINDEDIGAYFENLDPLSTLRLLIENRNNLEMNLEWRTQDVIDGGWTNEKEIFVGVEEVDKFLIVTEGSSDTFIIKKSLELLKPDILDFFTFVDMEENYPFTGTGNLYRFCQGLTSIRIQNKTLVLFDNDLEGIDKFNKANNLNLPSQMKIMKLPDLEEFTNFLTIGPTGKTNENINGKAVAIECFLDLTKSNPKIRWTNYNKDFDAYQGSLENKDDYVRKFKTVKNAEDNYDFTKLTRLLDEIYKNCI